VVFVVAVVLGLGFGAGDQYVGSLAAGLWTVSLSQLSAPWLLLPFAFGCTQPRSSRAATAGLVATLSGLTGYFLMVMGPFDGGQWTMTLREMHGLFTSNRLIIIGGFVTGPVFAWLGHLWRTQRAWVSALAVAGSLCLEPLALVVTGRNYPGSAIVWPAEIAAGIVLAGFFFVTGLGHRRRGTSELGKPTAA
jgi:hypothetical protein